MKDKSGDWIELLAQVEKAILTIREDPWIGSPYKETEFRYFLVRRFPYVIYYADLPERLWIVAIAHSRQRPSYWSRRKVE
jgi:toxin ParE1/3/4